MMLSYDYTSKYICWFFQLNYLSRCKFPSKVFVWRKHDGVRQYTWKSVQLWRPTDFSVVKTLCIYNIYTGLPCGHTWSDLLLSTEYKWLIISLYRASTRILINFSISLLPLIIFRFLFYSYLFGRGGRAPKSCENFFKKGVSRLP